MSLCRPKGYFAYHPVRREVYLVDRDAAHTPALDDALDDVLGSIDAFHAEGGPVLVHCHGGRSRTGLVLRAWLQRHEGLSYDAALAEGQAAWPHLWTENESFESTLRHLTSGP